MGSVELFNMVFFQEKKSNQTLNEPSVHSLVQCEICPILRTSDTTDMIHWMGGDHYHIYQYSSSLLSFVIMV